MITAMSINIILQKSGIFLTHHWRENCIAWLARVKIEDSGSKFILQDGE